MCLLPNYVAEIWCLVMKAKRTILFICPTFIKVGALSRITNFVRSRSKSSNSNFWLPFSLVIVCPDSPVSTGQPVSQPAAPLKMLKPPWRSHFASTWPIRVLNFEFA